jgi:hypothetical protein
VKNYFHIGLARWEYIDLLEKAKSGAYLAETLAKSLRNSATMGATWLIAMEGRAVQRGINLIRSIVLVILVIGTGLLWSGGGVRAAVDSPGCDGFGEYQTEMNRASQTTVDAADEAGIVGRDPMTFSTDEWKAMSDIYLDLQGDVKEIDPPTGTRTGSRKSA